MFFGGVNFIQMALVIYSTKSARIHLYVSGEIQVKVNLVNLLDIYIILIGFQILAVMF